MSPHRPSWLTRWLHARRRPVCAVCGLGNHRHTTRCTGYATGRADLQLTWKP